MLTGRNTRTGPNIPIDNPPRRRYPSHVVTKLGREGPGCLVGRGFAAVQKASLGQKCGPGAHAQEVLEARVALAGKVLDRRVVDRTQISRTAAARD